MAESTFHAMYEAMHVDDSLCPPIAFPHVIAFDDAMRALLLAHQGARVAVVVRERRDATAIVRDFHGLLATGAFGRCNLSVSGLWVSFPIGGGRIEVFTESAPDQVRGKTFAHVIYVRAK